MHCALCNSENLTQIYNKFVNQRRFFKCFDCDLIFVPSSEHVSAVEEKKRYQKHQNTNNNPIQDAGYIQFLKKAIEPVCEMIPRSKRSKLKVLDYGCGEGKSFFKIAEQEGFFTEGYDPYFENDLKLLIQKWDLIFSTEVWEHFRDPKNEITKVFKILNPNGIIAIMTQLHNDINGYMFQEWWYPKDFTHLAFYSAKTIQYIASQFNFNYQISGDSVVIFYKPQ